MLVLAGGIVRPLRFIPLQLLVFRLRGLGMRVFVTGGAGFIGSALCRSGRMSVC